MTANCGAGENNLGTNKTKLIAEELKEACWLTESVGSVDEFDSLSINKKPLLRRDILQRLIKQPYSIGDLLYHLKIRYKEISRSEIFPILEGLLRDHYVFCELTRKGHGTHIFIRGTGDDPYANCCRCPLLDVCKKRKQDI